MSYAALDPYPDIEPGWWCVAIVFKRVGGHWQESNDDDNSTTPRPFVRPSVPARPGKWVAWHSNGALWGDGEAARHHHVVFGVAPTTTARLTVTDRAGRARELAITPWSGAYLAVVGGDFSRLTGYDRHGVELGSFTCNDGPSPEPDDEPAPPGYERGGVDTNARPHR